MIALTVLEEIIDVSGVAPRIELMLPIGARRRQLKVRTLLAGMCWRHDRTAGLHRPPSRIPRVITQIG